MIATLAQCARRTFATALLVLACASFAAAQSKPPRPHRAALGVTITSVTPVSATELLLTYEGTGNGTHVGRYRESGSYLLDLTTFLFAGAATVTAADGSTFSFTLAGGFTGPTTLAGTTSVTGGTGRFAGATGAFTFSGVQTSPRDISARVNGWIRF